MSTLNVTLVQHDLIWHDAGANREALTAAVDALEESSDVIILPEMFTTGFSMDAESQAEPMDGPTVEWLRSLAKRTDSAVCGSIIAEENGQYFNRFLFVRPSGAFEQYDKRHLLRLADEHVHYRQGMSRITFEYCGWRICPMICYDLRFPVWSRNLDDFDLLLYVANWPSRRHFAWQNLIRARAIENQCYVAAVNRCGTDGNDLPYLGGSAAIDYLGKDIVDLGEQAGTGTTALDMEALLAFRERYPFHLDADTFELRI